MSLVRCIVPGCPHWIRDGLVRYGRTDAGKDLADGRRCWRCRSGRRSHIALPPPTPSTPQPPGLERMRDRTPAGLCPFCLDPLPKSAARHCGDEACERAYHRTYQRDRRSGNYVREQRVTGPRGGRR